ncbi:MAG TPA: citryl-CoA lyase [Steroidobacteraceae bacterium]|nr:citryl-CoA lyase [Steroidobacteraceae bacterium]
MKIGRQEHRSSALSTSNAETIVVRGKDLCRDLIGQVGFSEYFWFLLCGELPRPAQRRVLDATLVAIAEHGLVPSVQAARMTHAAAPEALQGAVAAGLLGCGSVILGAAQDAGRLLAEVVAGGAQADMAAAAITAIQQRRAAKQAIPGYGHPLHKGEDPRATRLFAVAAEAGLPDAHRRAARQIEALLPALTGKPLVMNVSAAIPAVLLDAGFPLGALRGVPLLARTASLVAHLLEEQLKPIGFVLSHAAAKAIDYDGPVPPGFQRGDT